MGSDNDPPISLDDFLTLITQIYQKALAYYSNDTSKANLHTMEWIRHWFYDWWPVSSQWNNLLGPMDRAFLEIMDKSGIQKQTFYSDPRSTEKIRIAHLFATMNGAYLKGSPSLPAVGTTDVMADINEGDVAGWGGDWINLYGEWNVAVYQGKTPEDQGREFCNARLASQTPNSHFKMRPMIEDADGYNIGMMLKNNASLTLPDALRRYFKPTTKVGYRTRFTDFYNARFGSTTASTANITFSMLRNLSNNTINSIRFNLIEWIFFPRLYLWGPRYSAVPSIDNTRKFCLGFDDVMKGLVQKETNAP